MVTTERYHFTCDHGASAILRTGELRPNYHPMLRASVAWLTDNPAPDLHELGMADPVLLTCDRGAWRVTVDACGPIYWPRIRGAFSAPGVWALEQTEGVDPATWYVVADPMPVLAVERVRAPEA